MIILDHRAPRLQRTHGEGVALEIIARVIQHLIRVPIVRENSVAPVYAQDGVVAVKRRLCAHVAG